MSTIEDVAKRAGVSAMTVSRVINNSGYINDKTRARVQQAIAELGYVPNALARSLRFKQTKTLALVLTDITNPFFTTMARGVEDTASAQGFTVMFCNTDESMIEEAKYLNVLAQKQVDGVLLVPAFCSPDSVTFLRERNIPFVVLDRRIPDIQVDTVRCDSEEGGYQLTLHLLNLGHRQIAALNGPLEATTAADRLEGYRRAFAEAGLHEPEALILTGGFTIDSGYEMAQHALANTPRPTALFAANNFIAVGAYRAIRDAGLGIPDEVSLVSFDDISATMVLDPFLTEVGQPAYEMGRQATLLLLERLAGIGAAEPQDIVMPTRLIVRRSTAEPYRTIG
jgi:LacI family transcriptional regulator